MRITQSMMSRNFLNNLSHSLTSLDRLQNQQSTGKKISKPSDDPVIAVRSIQYGSQINMLQQYMRNADTAVKWMDSTDSSIQEANNIFKTIREKLVQGTNGPLDADSRTAIAREMEQLKEQLGSIANTSIAGRFIFAGTDTDKPPYQNGAFVSTNTDDISMELGKDVFMNINVNGTELFGYKDPATGKDIFQLMDQIIATLNNDGDTNPLLDQLQVHEFNFVKVHTALGANMNRLALIQDRLDEHVYITTDFLSKEEDADLAEVIINLNMQENVYRMALGTGARLLPPSLLDFMR